MNKREALETMFRMLHVGGIRIIESAEGHPEQRRRERKITVPEATRIIVSGRMVKGPAQHRLGFECVMRGKADDGRSFDIPVIVDVKANRVRVKSYVPEGKKGR